MIELTTELLGRACEIFLGLAYPDGPTTMLANKRAYLDMKADASVYDYLPPAPAAVGIAQKLPCGADGRIGYEFRLGCSHYRNLKMRVQSMEFRDQVLWVFSVNTHDAFSLAAPLPPADHPDACEWFELQRLNRELKIRIEDAFEATGLHTFKSLLKMDLYSPSEFNR